MRNFYPSFFVSSEGQKGQVLLLVILVLVVAVTVGMSIAAQSIVNVRLTSEEENSQRAFSAAEAGLAQSDKTQTAQSGTFSNNSQFQTAVTPLSGSQLLLNNYAYIPKDEGVDLWLSQYPGYLNPWSGTITIHWGKQGDVCNADPTVNTMAALEVILISGTKNNPKITHYAVDGCNTGRRAQNNFTAATGGGTVLGKTFSSKITLPAITSGLVMRIVPLYANTQIAVVSSVPLPSQGETIDSTGSAGSTTRKITLFKGYPKIPAEFFQFVLFSPR